MKIALRKLGWSAWPWWAIASVCAVGMVFDGQGAEKSSAPSRVFRIELTSGRQPRLVWTGGDVAGWVAITNRFSTNGVGMTDRDFVLVQHDRDLSKSEKRSLGFVVRACDKVTAQLHYLPVPKGGLAARSLLVVHYITPFDHPRDQRQTDYFVEEVWVGKGDEGFDATLASMKSRGKAEVVWLGSRYFFGSSWSPGEVPYRGRLEKLDAATRAKIERYDLQRHEFGLFPQFVP